MNEDALHEKLEKYVRGRLSPEDAAALERELAKDAALREQLRLHRLELEAHEYLLRDQLRQNVRKWVNESPPDATPSSPATVWQKWGLVMLIVALVAAISIWFMNQNPETLPTQPSEQKKLESVSPDTVKAPIASQAETPPEVAKAPVTRPERRTFAMVASLYKEPLNIRGTTLKNTQSDQEDSTAFGAGIRAYKQGKFQTAVLEFKKITPQNNPAQYDLSREWLAHAWLNLGLKTGNFQAAVAEFQAKVDQKTDDVAQDRAEWYLLLCLSANYPQQKQKVDKLILDITGQKFHSYREDAEKLQAELRGIK